MSVPHYDVDVLIVGSGFAGSLTALLCQRIGLQPLVVDARSHPRFAIGESSTPLANLVLESLGERYGLDWLKPFANYTSWKQAYPTLGVGLKRGFSYFYHTRGEVFVPRADHANELLVAASHGPDDADTHWVRADFDHFLVQQVQAAGIPYFEQTRLGPLHAAGQGWRTSGFVATTAGDSSPRWECAARFLIDATGDGGYLTRELFIGNAVDSLKTWSRAVFGHFRNVTPWEDLYRTAGGRADDHPFPADDAALHHVFDGGWMWNLRFDHGVTSAGFSLDGPGDPTLTPEQEWRQLLATYPSIAEQYRSAELVAPAGGIVRTGRLQRLASRAAGPNWALLPYAAGFIDALHSTGNSHTLIGIERLIAALERHWNTPQLADELAAYDRLVRQEVILIDRIVSGSYRGFRDFPRMVAMSLFYFATAIWSEVRRRSDRDVPRAFLCADEPALQAAVQYCWRMVSDAGAATDDVVRQVRAAIGPFNIARLGEPKMQNLYPYV